MRPPPAPRAAEQCKKRRLRRPRRRLFWRIYLQGLLLLLATAVAAGFLSKLFEGSPWKNVQQRLFTYIQSQLSEADTVDELDAVMASLHSLVDTALILYDLEGQPVSSAGDDNHAPPLSNEDARDLSRVRTDYEDGNTITALPITLHDGRRAILMMSWNSRANLYRFIASLLAILCVVALVLYPLARAIARPLERITAAAGAITEGDLSARSGVKRKDEIGVLARRFDAMAERIERLIRSEKELLANVSHELRTPLARIRIALELCEDERDIALLHEHLEGIGIDSQELEQLIDEVLVAARLDLAQGDALSSVLRIQPHHADVILNASVDRFTIRHPKHTLENHIPPDLPIIEADAELLRRVFDNLLENAAKYGLDPIELHASHQENTLVITVSDHGPGVPEDQIPRLFEAFYRADESRSTPGLGLGLTLCQRIVEVHDGLISVELPDPPDTGFSVRITLPVA